MQTKFKLHRNFTLLMVFGCFTVASTFAQAQQITSTSQYLKNELKANFLGLAIGLPEISYERLVNQHNSIGIAAAALIQNNKGDKEHYRFMFTPYYHHYFGKNYATGFFLEANATMFSDKKDQADDGGVSRDKIYYGLGGGIGMKRIFGKGIIAELVIGLGSTLNNNPIKIKRIDLGLYRRLSLSIGKRF